MPVQVSISFFFQKQKSYIATTPLPQVSYLKYVQATCNFFLNPFKVTVYQVWNTSLPTGNDSSHSNKGLPAVLRSFMAGVDVACEDCLFAGQLPWPADN